MTRDREPELFGRDPLTVVGDPDPPRASTLEGDLDPSRACIEGVLDQLLDDGGGPFDDLARRDLVDESGGELLDPGHGTGSLGAFSEARG